jgi:hypothetical protein
LAGGNTVEDNFYVHLDHRSGQPVREIYLAMLPTEKGWQTPAFVKFGGWNYCPPPEVHVAASKKWEQQYEVEVVAITGDTMEFYVSNPPQSREEALKLAQGQFLYCADIVYQGTQTLERLAATLQNNHSWFFWWD